MKNSFLNIGNKAFVNTDKVICSLPPIRIKYAVFWHEIISKEPAQK